MKKASVYENDISEVLYFLDVVEDSNAIVHAELYLSTYIEVTQYTSFCRLVFYPLDLISVERLVYQAYTQT